MLFQNILQRRSAAPIFSSVNFPRLAPKFSQELPLTALCMMQFGRVDMKIVAKNQQKLLSCFNKSDVFTTVSETEPI